MTMHKLSEADVAYIAANYSTLEGGMDRLRDFFAARYRAASQAEPGHVDRPDEDWTAYMDGIYGVCLRQVTPEAIVRKAVLVTSLSELLTLARPVTRTGGGSCARRSTSWTLQSASSRRITTAALSRVGRRLAIS